jgi:hypothetical protein
MTQKSDGHLRKSLSGEKTGGGDKACLIFFALDFGLEFC